MNPKTGREEKTGSPESEASQCQASVSCREEAIIGVMLSIRKTARIKSPIPSM